MGSYLNEPINLWYRSKNSLNYNNNYTIVQYQEKDKPRGQEGRRKYGQDDRKINL